MKDREVGTAAAARGVNKGEATPDVTLGSREATVGKGTEWEKAVADMGLNSEDAATDKGAK